MKISVVGTGYVGLVTGIGFASLGHQIMCVDIEKEKISLLNNKVLPIWEKGLDSLFNEVQLSNPILFTTSMTEALQHAELLFVCVGTPSLPNGEADLTQVWSVIETLVNTSELTKIPLIVIKSTVPVGTCDKISHYLSENGIDAADIIHNPEFLRQGNAVSDFFHPDRILIGCTTQQSQESMKDLYKDFASPIMICDRRSAELVKYGSNAFLAMKISYINMLAELSETLGTNIEDVAIGIGADRRIGGSFLKAGIGYGGSCFPKDIKALQTLAHVSGIEVPLLRATESINQHQPLRMVQKLKETLGTLQGKKVTLLGLSFKPLTGDTREAPSIKVSRLCTFEGAYVHAYDPLIRKFPVEEVTIHDSIFPSLNQADAAIILTEWDEFYELDWGNYLSVMKNPIVFDGRNLYSLERMQEIASRHKLTYLSIGRPSIYGIPTI